MGIRAEELRIGNWLFHTGGAGYIQVTGEMIAHIERFPDEKFMTSPPRDILKPIEITEDILIKCGFGINMTGTAWWDKEQNIIISQKDNRFCYAIWGGDFDEPATEEICELKYLHQLQNIYFDLSGKELEIKEL